MRSLDLHILLYVFIHRRPMKLVFDQTTSTFKSKMTNIVMTSSENLLSILCWEQKLIHSLILQLTSMLSIQQVRLEDLFVFLPGYTSHFIRQWFPISGVWFLLEVTEHLGDDFISPLHCLPLLVSELVRCLYYICGQQCFDSLGADIFFSNR